MAQVRGLGLRVGGRLGAVLQSSREPGVRRPCSDFMDIGHVTAPYKLSYYYYCRVHCSRTVIWYF